MCAGLDVDAVPLCCCVAESHILEDVNRCIVALRERDTEGLDRAAGAIRGRAARLAHIVAGEMDSYEPGAYTEAVMMHVQHLTAAGKAGCCSFCSVQPFLSVLRFKGILGGADEMR